MLRPRAQPMKGPLGWFLDRFNAFFDRTTDGYISIVKLGLRRLAIMGVLLLAFMRRRRLADSRRSPAAWFRTKTRASCSRPSSFPTAPRWNAPTRSRSGSKRSPANKPGVSDVVALGGFNLLTGSYSPNNVTFIVSLTPGTNATGTRTSGCARSSPTSRANSRSYPEGVGFAFIPPPIPGLGTSGGFTFELQDRGGHTAEELARVANDFVAKARNEPALARSTMGLA